MGGFVAAEAVIDQPERFAKLVLRVRRRRLERAPAARPTEVVARMLAAGDADALRARTRASAVRRARAMAFAASSTTRSSCARS